MKSFRVKVLAIVIVSFTVIGCEGIKPSPDYMILDKIEYIKGFPKQFDVDHGEQIDLDIIGIGSLSIKDTLLIVSTSNKDGFWAIFSLPEYKPLGKYLTKGNGPNELLSEPRMNEVNYFEFNGELFALLYDFYSGKSYDMNITKTLSYGRLIMNSTDYELPSYLFRLTRLNDSLLLCKEPSVSYTQQIRYIQSNGQRRSSENLKKLNLSSSQKNGGLNVLDTYTKCSRDGNLIVEAAMDLNQINLYSVDDSFGKTICVGAKVDNISTIQNVERRNKVVTYKHLATYSDFFGALYINDTQENIYEERSKMNVIQFFSWNGNPLAEIKLERMINSFDIDFLHGCLYTLSYETEEVYKHDISKILQYMSL
ncbi:MAG: TolB-like 6-bladed beta-propeller domain-containing protein [Oscillospiraceae bacterium]|jgi:hypothetical protein|nr:TolB-like 6-bladed beta-propeller domain-containing protein [Oscillospiraceae bacterium]